MSFESDNLPGGDTPSNWLLELKKAAEELGIAGMLYVNPRGGKWRLAPSAEAEGFSHDEMHRMCQKAIDNGRLQDDDLAEVERLLVAYSRHE